ncbi:sensor histidine kinase [Sulfobacillus harzensis]|uniref:histidine kinase n=1 Tax=Sulfobacillus harzensis TaxID=2729629 RepID=A0A7Y0L7E2_9FIRM|nr:sensor histidine kinase [Sulfobacillus harzensis]NMP24388.1 sensor histidine kinase [Sulfobacillus harzensis]
MNRSQQAVRILEEERRRFARDLHDGPVQVLSNTSMRLDMLSQLIQVNPTLAEEEIRRMHHRLIQATTELRQLIYDLQPIAVDAMGLDDAFKGLAHRVQRDWAVPVSLHVSGDVRVLPAHAAMMLYRAVQEALTNAAKHAEARAIRIELTASDDRVTCVVADDGKGFDPTHRPVGHYGLGNMVERLEVVGGQADLASAPGRGTRITFTVPCA